MNRNPILHAFCASVYIGGLVTLVNMIMDAGSEGDGNGILIPVMMLSLFTLSAAVMGYLFCYEPLRLYLDGRKEEALSFFLKTVGVFAVLTFFVVCLVFFTLK